jgi:hypothetical protein
MQCTAKKRVIIGNQDFVCGHFSNDPVFHGRTDAFSPHQSNTEARQNTAPKEHERREKPEQNSGSNSAGALIGAKHAQPSQGGQA